MLSKNPREKRKQIQYFCIDDLVPENHILRDIEKAVDFDFIYDEVKDLYSDEIGRPSIDPVVLFKIVLIQYTFGIRSMRQTIKEIEVNVAYRWFLGFDLTDKIPHFSTFGKNYVRRFKGTDIFEKIFEHILSEAVDCGFVDASTVFIDATHIKANANTKKSINEVVKKEAKHYEKELEEEILKDRIEHGKKPLKTKDDDENPPTKNIKKSTTDPESGLFHKGEHKVVFAHTAHTVCDKHNFVLGVEVTPGNIHDSVVFDKAYADVLGKFPEIETIAMDSGYKTPWIMKQVFDSGRNASTPYKRPMTKKGFFKKYEFVYDEYFDCVICPQNQILKYTTTNRDGYREFKSNPNICNNCPSKDKCTNSRDSIKVYTLHIWDKYMELAEDYRHSPQGKENYALRSQTIERVFADAKEKHGMRYTQLRGTAKVRMQVVLTFACMNLKKLAKWKRRGDYSPRIFAFLKHFITNMKQGIGKLLPIPCLSSV